MRHALRLAMRGLGQVAPNPAVGCVIVRDGVVVGRGWTARGGRPHAEALALAQAGDRARGATVYVTLEPCAHHGQTPPCADALIAAGVSRVVCAIVDPDERVNGNGLDRLEAAGIEVVNGICETEALEANRGFFLRITEGRPTVSLKIAESADGFVAPANGQHQWITSAPARAHGHLLRATHDAIMIGIGTALADDPLLTCRLDGLEDRSPLRVVLDSRLRLPPDSQLVLTAGTAPVLVFTAKAGAGSDLGSVEVVRQDPADLGRVLHTLAGRGVTRLLVEGGPALHRSLLAAGLVDHIYRYRAPLVLGSGIQSALKDVGASRIERRMIGPDVLESFAVKG